MVIDVGVETDAATWNDLLERSRTPSPFHRYECLSVCAAHAGMELQPLVGSKGQEVVGLFPLFTTTIGVFTLAFSPPPHLKIPYLGPTMVMAGSPKRRRHDLQHRRFVDGCLDWLAAEHNPGFTNIRSAVGYADARPFAWRGFDVTPGYTYSIRLDGRDELLDRFSGDARRNVRGDHGSTVAVTDGGHETIRRVIDQIHRRHAEQDERFPVDAEFVTDLFDRLPAGIVRPYRLSVDGEFAVGVINLEYAGRALRWIGGARTDHALPVNDLLLWEICLDGLERGVERYDLVGANHPRLWDYKAKFGPDLEEYYMMEDGTWTMSMAKRCYDYFR